MRRSVRFAVSAAVAWVLLPAGVRAQAQDCFIEPTDNTRMNSLNNGTMIFIGGGVFVRCEGGLTIRSDSLAYLEVSGITEFIGNVEYQDTAKALTSDYAQYMGRQRQLLAQGNVRLRDLDTGAFVTSPHLNYFQPTEGRPESRIEIHSGRPHAVMIREGTEAGVMDTTVVDADAMTIVGESQFSGRGNVVVTRATTRGYGNSAMFDQQQGLMMLSGNARLESEEYDLFGDEIRGRTDERQNLTEVEAERNARIESEELQVEAPFLRVYFEEGQFDRLVAVGSALRSPQPGVAATQAVAVSQDFRLVADSIDARAPLQVLEQVIAVGTALGERLAEEDSLRARLPAVMARDWVRGDTIVATFGPAPPDTAPPADAVVGGAEERVLESIVAIGADPPASSVYRFLRAEDGAAAYNYMAANRILVVLAGGEVEAVEAEGQIRGVYLDPVPVAAPPEGTSGTGRSP